MALDPSTGVRTAQQGETTMRAAISVKLEFDGDAAYPGAAGSANFQQFVRTVVGDQVTVTGVTGHAITGAALTHIMHYDDANDTLEMFQIAAGVAEGAGDLSGARIHLVVFAS